MSSYYREHVTYPNVAAGPYPADLIAELERNAAARAAVAASSGRNANGDDPDVRICSVKGCSAQLPEGYTNKMCEECRGRHRVYAMTKRAKRKMEKALLNGSAAQNGQVVWMPQDEGIQHEPEQPVAGPSGQYEVMSLFNIFVCSPTAYASSQFVSSPEMRRVWNLPIRPVLR